MGVIAIDKKKNKKRRLKRHNTLCNPKQFVWWKRRWYKNDCGWTLRVKRVGVFLEEQRSHAAHFALLLYEDLKVLVDDGHGQEDTSTRTNGA